MTHFIAEKKTAVKNIKAVVTVYNQEKRPEITYLLKNIEEFDLHRGEIDNLKRYLSDLGLFDKKLNRVTDAGHKAIGNDMVAVPQSGLYSLSYVNDPAPGVNSQIVDFKPEKPVWQSINKETRSMPDFRNFDDVEFISWNKDRHSFRVKFERPDGSDPRIIENNENLADIRISGNSGDSCSLNIISNDLSYKDNNYGNISVKDNICTLVPDYDKNFDAVRVNFSDIKNDKSAVEKFKKSHFDHFDGKSLIFNSGDDDDRWNVRIEDVDLIPKTKSDAEEWIFYLTADKLTKNIEKFYFTMDYCNDACRSVYVKTLFSRAFPSMKLDIVRFREYLMENNPGIFSEIEIAEDLCPNNNHNSTDFEFTSGDNTRNSGLTEEELEAIINSGEDERTEFKETLFGINTGDEKYTSIFKAMKTIAAFMNSSGGNLLIGISDNGGIKGINGDYQIVNKSLNKDRRDAFRLRFDQEFEKYIGNTFCDDIKMDILSVNGKDICRINVKARESPVHIKSQRNDSEKFFCTENGLNCRIEGF